MAKVWIALEVEVPDEALDNPYSSGIDEILDAVACADTRDVLGWHQIKEER